MEYFDFTDVLKLMIFKYMHRTSVIFKTEQNKSMSLIVMNVEIYDRLGVLRDL